MTNLFPYRGILPKVAPDAFVAPSASVIGDVQIGSESSIWFGAVLRGDVMPIRVGARTSIQDNSVVHSTRGWWAVDIGDDCVVGHAVTLHGATIHSRVLVGMSSTILDAAEIGSDTILGAGSLVTARTKIPSGVLAMGRPAKVIRELRPEELEQIAAGARDYVKHCREYREELG